MSKSDYGILSSLESIYTYLLAGFGLNNAVLRWMVLKDDPGEKRGTADCVVAGGTAVNIVIVIGAITEVMILGDSFSNYYYYLLSLMLIALSFQYLFDAGTFSFRALLKNGAFAITLFKKIIILL